MARVTYRLPIQADYMDLAARMRRADKLEVKAVTGIGGRNALAERLELSVAQSYRAYTAERDGRLLAIFGTSPISMLTGLGCLWMLATGEVYRTPRVLTKLARLHIAEVEPVFPRLTNYVDVRNTRSLKWLEWLGATIHEPKPYGVAGLPFRQFEIGIGYVR